MKIPMRIRFLAMAGVLGSATMLAACGGSSGSEAAAAEDEQLGRGIADQLEFLANRTKIEGPLDALQDEVVSAVVGDQVGGRAATTLGPTVQCAADAVNSLVDAPDALLAALASLPAGADPAVAFQTASAQMAGSLERFAAELQSTLSP